MAKYRTTKSVQTILDVFGNTNMALSVVELVKKFHDDMNKTTVYRILERLENKGVLHSFSGVNGLKWFAKTKGINRTKTSADHGHFQCAECGMSKCISIDINIPKIPKHKINSASMILIGQCEDCL